MSEQATISPSLYPRPPICLYFRRNIGNVSKIFSADFLSDKNFPCAPSVFNEPAEQTTATLFFDTQKVRGGCFSLGSFRVSKGLAPIDAAPAVIDLCTNLPDDSRQNYTGIERLWLDGVLSRLGDSAFLMGNSPGRRCFRIDFTSKMVLSDGIKGRARWLEG